MKKILLFAVLFLSLGMLRDVKAQEVNLKDIQSISFYGVDFSYAKVYGATETGHQFLEAFERINLLFESEPKKYSARKMFNVKNDELFNRQLKLAVDDISPRELFTDDNHYVVSDDDIRQAVAKLEKQGESEYGAVIICGLLNKTANRGTFTFVIFDQASNEIIFQQEQVGKARGFGLRNFWAGALLAASKKVR